MPQQKVTVETLNVKLQSAVSVQGNIKGESINQSFILTCYVKELKNLFKNKYVLSTSYGSGLWGRHFLLGVGWVTGNARY